MQNHAKFLPIRCVGYNELIFLLSRHMYMYIDKRDELIIAYMYTICVYGKCECLY